MKTLNEELTRQHFSARVYKAYFYYLRTHHPEVNVAELCEEAGLPYEYILDEKNWVSVIFDHRFTQLCIEKSKDQRLCYKVGAQQLSEEVIGTALHLFTRHTLSIEFIYKQMASITALFSKVTKVFVIESRVGFVHLNFFMEGDHLNEYERQALKENFKNIFDNTIGHFASIPSCQNMPPALVEYEHFTTPKGTPGYDIKIRYTSSPQAWKLIALAIAIIGSILLGWFLKSNEVEFWPSFLMVSLFIMSLFTGIFFFKNRYLEKGFNQVVEALAKMDQRYLDLQEIKENLRELSHSYERFVPKEFLKLLKHESILDVEIGDNIEAEMTILFCDIRNFTQLSETLNPHDNFRFLNSYLQRISPIIRKHGGFIDKYMGDGIMAIFPYSPAKALQASVDIISTIEEYNIYRRKLNYVPIQVGIGLNTGRLVLGTLGTQEQMQGTVVSDCVNTAARLEQLTKQLDASILVSEETLNKAALEASFEMRYIGKLALRGKAEKIPIYEIYQGDTKAKKELRQTSLPYLEQGLQAYDQEDFPQARRIFEQLLQKCPQDLVALHYLNQIDSQLHHSLNKNVA